MEEIIEHILVEGLPVEFIENLVEGLPVEFIKNLLNDEKKRAGLSSTDLYYVGIADTASWWWCARKSILSNMKMEVGFFVAHLVDRIEHALTVLAVKKAQSEVGMLLKQLREMYEERNDDKKIELFKKILSNLPVLELADIEGLLRTVPRYKYNIDEDVKIGTSTESVDERIMRSLVMFKDDPKEYGIYAQDIIGEKYPSIRWAFKWKDFMINGIPDGITDKFVYEFKTVGSEFLLNHIIPVAFTQADLYGYFFKRDMKKVQIFVKDKGKKYTWIERVDNENAEETLQKFRKAVREHQTLPLPKQWKCNKCEFKQICTGFNR
jgi:CRISPR/Cas system-associated exonuclease Cas4 (RecB family)